MSNTINMRDMLEAGAHFGHRCSRWNPKMKPFIFGARNGIYFLNLEKTYFAYKAAAEFAAQTAAKGKKVLFVGTKTAAAEVLQVQAERSGMPWVNHRWLGGTLTNWNTIKQSIEKLRRFEKLATEEHLGLYTKREMLTNER